MGRSNGEDQKFYNPRIESGWKLGSMEWVPVDNEVFDADSPPLVFLNPAGAVDVLMPAVTPDMKGLTFLFSNVSGNAVTLKTSADAAFATAIVLAAGESALVFCTGSGTANLGWRACATASSA